MCVVYRLLGWDKVLEYSTDEWLRDITSYQLPLLFKGVGPLNSFSQLGKLYIYVFNDPFFNTMEG